MNCVCVCLCLCLQLSKRQVAEYKLRAVLARVSGDSHLLCAQSFHAWRHHTTQCKQKYTLSHVASSYALHRQQTQCRRMFATWRHVATVRRVRFTAAENFAMRSRKRTQRQSFRCWHQVATRLSRRRKLLTSYTEKWIRFARRVVFSRWREKVERGKASERQVRLQQHSVVLCLSAQMRQRVMRMFYSWRSTMLTAKLHGTAVALAAFRTQFAVVEQHWQREFPALSQQWMTEGRPFEICVVLSEARARHEADEALIEEQSATVEQLRATVASLQHNTVAHTRFWKRKEVERTLFTRSLTTLVCAFRQWCVFAERSKRRTLLLGRHLCVRMPGKFVAVAFRQWRDFAQREVCEGLQEAVVHFRMQNDVRYLLLLLLLYVYFYVHIYIVHIYGRKGCGGPLFMNE